MDLADASRLIPREGHWACRAGVTSGAWSLLKKETDWGLRGGKDRWEIRGYVGRRGELCVASIRAFLCGLLALELYFDCTLHRGYSFLPKPKPTMSFPNGFSKLLLHPLDSYTGVWARALASLLTVAIVIR